MLADAKAYLKSYSPFMQELGWRRSAENFYTSSIICCIASVFGAISWGDWRNTFFKAVTGMVSGHLFLTCLIVTVLMLIGHMFCRKYPRIRVFFFRSALWAGRLCLDLGAAMMGAMIGMAPLMWFVEGVSGLAYLSVAFWMLLLLAAIAVIVHEVWYRERHYHV